MTKTLTEQWREGTLPAGCYYVRFFTTKQPHIEICGSEFLSNLAEFNGTDRAEVLATVPDYMDCKGLIYDSINLQDARKRIDELVSKTEQLEKKLEIATKALKGVSLWANTGNGGEKAVKKVCETALTKMKGKVK